ncbi:hypothetical protein [Aliidiomarina soli]|uniref:Uncharacterized protein n=1 Tax=Aliidiomarina soli TaxID=1928574 RepID=A0A432WMB3_9GAMM|nr:hypothetical protein [Aliidiomarina soli]RUO34829.1 hypothetical protein CWE14_02190 [Aliidiomarina soli]
MFAMFVVLIVVPFLLACVLQPFAERTAIAVGILVPVIVITAIPYFDPDAVGALYGVLYFIYVPIFAMATYGFWVIIGAVIERIRNH